jgi:ATP-binding cassette subfamily B (MDR/TAP) protein 1
MTLVLGQGFDAFSTYASNTLSHGVTQQDKDQLLHGVGIAAVELLALAVGAVALSSLMSSLWILVGERNILGLRRYVYSVVSNKEMEWFDLNMRSDQGSHNEADSATTTSGAAGLMAKFAK